jgi:VCBS repeat-containing protein
MLVDGSKEAPVDLCALDTQERNWIDGYTGGRVAVDLTGSDSEAVVESQDMKKLIEEAAL